MKSAKPIKPYKSKSKLALGILQHAEILDRGTMLAIDPSSGSQSSLPGYALFKAGKLVDAGVVNLPKGTTALSNRLFQLRNALFQEFEQPDLLAVELISPVMPSGGRFQKNTGSLIKAVGAILSVWDVPVVEPSPTTWHTMTPASYIKGDMHDACMIGWSCYITLARVRGEPEPTVILPEI